MRLRITGKKVSGSINNRSPHTGGVGEGHKKEIVLANSLM